MLTEEEVMKVIQKRKIERYKNGDKTPKVLNDILDYLTQNNDEELIEYIMTNNQFECFRTVPEGIKKLEKIVIKSGNAHSIYYFAKHAKKADINLLEEAIIKTGNVIYIYRFAKDIKGANIKALEKAIIETKSVHYILKFALYITGVDVKTLQDAIIKSGNARYMYYFAKFVHGADILTLYEAIINTKDAFYIELIIEDEELQKMKKNQIVLKEQAAENIISFATKIISEKQNREQIFDELIDNIDSEDNMLKLKIYSEFLTANKVTIEEAVGVDREYTNAVQLTKKNN